LNPLGDTYVIASTWKVRGNLFGKGEIAEPVPNEVRNLSSGFASASPRNFTRKDDAYR
jgi:hypothetical protein